MTKGNLDVTEVLLFRSELIFCMCYSKYISYDSHIASGRLGPENALNTYSCFPHSSLFIAYFDRLFCFWFIAPWRGYSTYGALRYVRHTFVCLFIYMFIMAPAWGSQRREPHKANTNKNDKK